MDYNKLFNDLADKGFELAGKAVYLGKKGKEKLDSKVAQISNSEEAKKLGSKIADLSSKAEVKFDELGKEVQGKFAEIKTMIDSASERLAEDYENMAGFQAVDTKDLIKFLNCYAESYNGYYDGTLDNTSFGNSIISLAHEYNDQSPRLISFHSFVHNKLKGPELLAVEAYLYVASMEYTSNYAADFSSSSYEGTLDRYNEFIDDSVISPSDKYRLKELIAEVVQHSFQRGGHGSLTEIISMLEIKLHTKDTSPLAYVQVSNASLMLAIINVEFHDCFIVDAKELAECI